MRAHHFTVQSAYRIESNRVVILFAESRITTGHSGCKQQQQQQQQQRSDTVVVCVCVNNNNDDNDDKRGRFDELFVVYSLTIFTLLFPILILFVLTVTLWLSTIHVQIDLCKGRISASDSCQFPSCLCLYLFTAVTLTIHRPSFTLFQSRLKTDIFREFSPHLLSWELTPQTSHWRRFFGT